MSLQSEMRLFSVQTFLLCYCRQIEREKLEAEEVGVRLRDERDKLDRSSTSYEHENQELQRTIQGLQQQLADTEHTHAQK